MKPGLARVFLFPSPQKQSSSIAQLDGSSDAIRNVMRFEVLHMCRNLR